MQKKHAIVLLAVGLPLMGMMGCGALVTVGLVAASLSDDTPQVMVPAAPGGAPVGFGQSAMGYGGPTVAPGPVGMAGLGTTTTGTAETGSWVQPYDATASTPGVNAFGQYIRDESSIQDNATGEIAHNVSNEVANPIVESGAATVVSPDTGSTASSGE